MQVGNVQKQMAGYLPHIVSELRLSLPTEDSSAHRCLSVEVVSSNDDGEVSSPSSLDEEGALELRTVQSSNVPLRASGGFKVQTPFFPGRIQVDAHTGAITVLPASKNQQQDVCESTVTRNIPVAAAGIAGKSSTAARKILPGQIINLRHCVQLMFVRVEHSDGSLYADRSIAPGDEVFGVVSLPIHENAFALKAMGNKRYLSCSAEGDPVRATCDEWGVGLEQCFTEEDAGDDRVAIRSVKFNQYIGGYHLKLSGTVTPLEQFQVLPATQIF
ncbi:hypothetical protein R1flu_026058 [Riccia fluitans]|uniref:Uncharacterized protein n=1 Tax=Riccia fluitans TaxID=41844 RepID=A0ABD1XEW7_9MARC